MSIAGLLIRRERLAREWSQEGLCRGSAARRIFPRSSREKRRHRRKFSHCCLHGWDFRGQMTKTVRCARKRKRAWRRSFPGTPRRSTPRSPACARGEYAPLQSLRGGLPSSARFFLKKDGERHPLDTEFVPFLDQRQLALQRVLEGRHEEAALLYPAAVIRLWQGAHLYARGRYAAATEALRAAYDAAAAEGYAHITMNCRVYLGNCCSDSGDLERMRQHYAVAQRLALALGDRDILSTIRYNEAATKIECGDFAAAYAYFAALEEPDAMSLHKLAVCCEALGRQGRGARRALRGRGDAPPRANARTRAADARACALSSWKRRTICATSAWNAPDRLLCPAAARARRGLRALPPQSGCSNGTRRTAATASLRTAGGLSCGKVKRDIERYLAGRKFPTDTALFSLTRHAIIMAR